MIAALVVVELRGKTHPAPNGIFFCAVIFSAWFGGQGPGTLATVLATVLAVFTSRYYAETTNIFWAAELPARTLFFGTGLFISWLTGRQQRAEAALRSMGESLERTVEERTGELTHANGELQAEISERKRAEALLNGEKRILEMVAKDHALPSVLDCLCRLIEEHAPNSLASILMVEAGRLRHGGAPNLPQAFVEAVDGTPIGPSVGSCGTAAFRQETVVVEDIATDSLWENYRTLALPHGLRACWSTPIFDAQRRLLGTFAMYYREPRKPQSDSLRLIEVATHIAAIAITGHRDRMALRSSDAKLKEAQRLAHVGYWERDLVSDRMSWSEETYRIFGIESAEEPLTQDMFLERVHPEDRAIQAKAFDKALRGRLAYNVEYRIARPDGEIRFVHSWDKIECDNSGRPIRMFGTVQDITERRQAEDALRRREDELRLVIDTIPVMAWTVRPDGRVDFLSRRWIDYCASRSRNTLTILSPRCTPTTRRAFSKNGAPKWRQDKATTTRCVCGAPMENTAGFSFAHRPCEMHSTILSSGMACPRTLRIASERKPPLAPVRTFSNSSSPLCLSASRSPIRPATFLSPTPPPSAYGATLSSPVANGGRAPRDRGMARGRGLLRQIGSRPGRCPRARRVSMS